MTFRKNFVLPQYNVNLYYQLTEGKTLSFTTIPTSPFRQQNN